MVALNPQDIHSSWRIYLESEFASAYMLQLQQFLQQELQAAKVIFPASKDIFNAFNSTPLDEVKVVILGQDPYHGLNQAHGLCFSVQPGIQPPPSLRNIFKEIARDLSLPLPNHGCLQTWADQGVLLLNAILTVEQAQAGAHQGRGWEQFTDRAIQVISQQCSSVVFLLWGSYAQKKEALIDAQKHLILRAPHPSPLSAYRGFFGCGHFSQVNSYLANNGRRPIDWRLP
jgi:uracil-DNA glycosylase